MVIVVVKQTRKEKTTPGLFDYSKIKDQRNDDEMMSFLTVYDILYEEKQIKEEIDRQTDKKCKL